MKIVYGDLIDLGQKGQFDAIVHGCNCYHTMGAGIAKQIKDVFPEAYEADLRTQYGDINKLGSISTLTASNDFGGPLNIVNAYTQFNCGVNGAEDRYKAIRMAFKEIKKKYSGVKIGYPMLGAGLAGGDWPKIQEIIYDELQGEDHTLVIWRK